MRFCSKSLRFVTASVLTFLIAFVVWGCGSASNNDQGTAWTFLGWFESSPASGATTTLPIGTSAIQVPLSTVSPETAGDVGLTPLIKFAGMQNNLQGEFIRSQRIFHSYFIEGANAQPPGTSYPLGVVIGPVGQSGSGSTTGVNTCVGFGSTLPCSFSDGAVGFRSFAGTPVVTPEVLSWINLNRTSLPEPPFTMLVTSHVTGITSSGDQLETNQIDLPVIFTPDVIIPPTDGGLSSSTSGAAAASSDGSGLIGG
jgi:hypothetical protein